MANNFNNPKRKRARYHRVTLSSGHILEIGWHFGRQKYVVSIYHPTKASEPDCWNAETQFFGSSPREVLSGARLAIAEEINPDIRSVRQRVTGNDDDASTLTVEKLMAARDKLQGTNPGPPLFDEMLDIADFEAFAADGLDALKYSMWTTDKKPGR